MSLFDAHKTRAFAFQQLGHDQWESQWFLLSERLLHILGRNVSSALPSSKPEDRLLLRRSSSYVPTQATVSMNNHGNQKSPTIPNIILTGKNIRSRAYLRSDESQMHSLAKTTVENLTLLDIWECSAASSVEGNRLKKGNDYLISVSLPLPLSFFFIDVRTKFVGILSGVRRLRRDLHPSSIDQSNYEHSSTTEYDRVRQHLFESLEISLFSWRKTTPGVYETIVREPVQHD